ncbi:putative membrane protein [Frankia casuarinae]|uniref:SHOCT domain-containing protein n=1 Tax=Frankia casuarinae (strain DSM 45818 / CECT 9043 / HFP020203 / CcI3) TaxID=106370 RepID=Q2JAU7_FRACC|nr:MULTISPECIES: SHOCT domain-containing protein [Frankia]ABD11595.1 conserved hypothetical protein [Frankia casuarinae]EYT90309.1 putative membrane protein [Frankia casuarinae]ORT47515.1 hypothetical protein KBI5_19295 [Frankia sp. KB5]
MMIWDGHTWGWGGWLLMSFSMVVFWGLVIGVLVALLRAGRGGGPGTSAEPPGVERPGTERPGTERPGTERPGERSAERILAERYARGEIDEAEYHRRLDVLRERPGPTDLTRAG